MWHANTQFTFALHEIRCTYSSKKFASCCIITYTESLVISCYFIAAISSTSLSSTRLSTVEKGIYYSANNSNILLQIHCSTPEFIKIKITDPYLRNFLIQFQATYVYTFLDIFIIFYIYSSSIIYYINFNFNRIIPSAIHQHADSSISLHFFRS